MGKEHILAFDIGTSSVKTSVIDRTGKTVASASKDYATSHPKAGIAEQNPEDWWKCACATAKDIWEQDKNLANHIAAIGVCGHMLGCVPVDAEGKPLANAMIHSDSRAYKQSEKISRLIGKQKLYEMSGNILDARSTLSKFLWLKEELPEVYGKTAKILQSKDYLTACLTGNIDTTDYSDASHGELMNIRTKDYEKTVYEELGLDVSKLPTLYAGKDVVGKLCQTGAEGLGLPSGIPVIAGGGDGACSDLGGGNVEVGNICCSLGTTAYFSSLMKEPYIDPQGRVFNIMGLDGTNCSLFGTIQSACGALNWVMDILGETDIQVFNTLAASVGKGSNGLIFVPYLDGERAPIFDAKARGVFFGLSQSHTRAHFARATFEGVAFALNSVLEAYREMMKVSSIHMIGGGAKSDLWRQIMADIWDAEVVVRKGAGSESNGLGIAAAAGVGIGLFESMEEAIGQMQVESSVLPQGDNQVYREEFAVYQNIYVNLKKQMHRLDEIRFARE